jgi:hypothetical protein
MSIQLFSTLKISDFGIEVSVKMTHGAWSDVVMARGSAKVFGKLTVQAKEEKNQSSLCRSGSSCILLQVNLLPLRGISTKPILLIASLNNSISFIFPPGLFLSWGDLRRLKSPTSK